MGTDIHAAIEYRQDGDAAWQALLTPNKYHGRYKNEPELTARVDIDRDYDVFSILGNVRNGYGFAGVPTGSGFAPISDGRGVPADITPEAREALSNEHSATWVTLAEILAYDWTRTTKKQGVVNGVTYEKWDRMKQWVKAPDNYCGGISGGRIKHVTEGEMKAQVIALRAARTQDFSVIENFYCSVEWEETYAEAGAQIWTAVLPHMLKLGAQVGFENVRLVMDFDS